MNKKLIRAGIAILLIIASVFSVSCQRSNIDSEESNLPSLRFEVSNEHPMLVVSVYGESYDSEKNVATMSANENLLDRWNAIPKDVQPYTVMEIHIGGIGKENGREEIEGFFESQLEIAEENSIPVVMVCVTAGQVGIYTKAGKIDFDWVDRMYKKYSSLVGIMATENYWTDYKAATRDCTKYLKISAENGGFLLWSEHCAKVIESITSNSDFNSAMKKYNKNFIFTWKNTPANMKKCTDAATASYMAGLWMTGLCDQWGGLIDTWKWWEKGYGLPFEDAVKKDNDNRRVVSEPEAAVGTEMMNIWANGGSVYNFENPTYVYGVDSKNTPIFEKVVLDVFRWAIKNPAPSKEETIESTKVVFSSTDKKLSKIDDFYSGLNCEDQTEPFYTSGRYGIIPALPPSVDLKTAKEIFKNAQIITSKSAEISTKEKKIDFFNSVYEENSTGNAFVQKVQDTFVVYNSNFNKNETETANINLESGKSISVEIEPYTFLMIKENGDEISVYLNNYRTDRTSIWSGNSEYNTEWDGSKMQDWVRNVYTENADASKKYDVNFALSSNAEYKKAEMIRSDGAEITKESTDGNKFNFTISSNGIAEFNISK